MLVYEPFLLVRYLVDQLQLAVLFSGQLKFSRLVKTVWTFRHKRSRFHRLSCFKTMRRFSDNDWISRKCSSLQINDKRLIFPTRQNPLPGTPLIIRISTYLVGQLVRYNQCLLMRLGTAALHGNELYHCFAWCHFLIEARLLLVAWNVFYLSQVYHHPRSKADKLLCSQCPLHTAPVYRSFRNVISEAYTHYRRVCSDISY